MTEQLVDTPGDRPMFTYHTIRWFDGGERQFMVPVHDQGCSVVMRSSGSSNA